MTWNKNLLALLLGALFLSSGIFACDPLGADDDDDVSDDDVSDDDDTADDDDTTAAYAEVVIELPEGISGTATLEKIENEEQVGQCQADPTCSIRTEHLGPHTVCVESDIAVFLCLEIEISVLASQQELTVWSGPAGEWGMIAQGVYRAYTDKHCSDLVDGDIYEVETHAHDDCSAFDIEGECVLLNGLIGTLLVYGDRIECYFGTVDGWISEGGTPIFYEDLTWSGYFCRQ